MKKLLITLTLSILTIASHVNARRFTLVIDPGHGGHDAGAIGAFSKEKDINLKTALALGKYLERYCPEVNVIYTRKTDVFVTLHGRADIANKAKADLFISIHTNAAPSRPSSIKGMETYTLGMHRAADNLAVAKRENEVILQEKDYQTRYQGFDPNSSESYIIFEFMQDNNMHKSVELAKYVQRSVCSTASRPDKGVKQAGFLVLRETSMPSCLIELGFISTPSDEQLLNDDKRIDDIARGIYQAFAQYKNKYDNNITIPYKAEDIEPMVVSQSNFKPTVTQQEPPTEKKPEVKPEQKQENKFEAKQVKAKDMPVFKVQIFAVDNKLNSSDPRFKGHKDTDYYKESGMVKYTIGESTDYNEINRLRKELNSTFPGCFVIAFKNGDKMNINEAIREFKQNK
jgi:N-acetylmuramoyl-L-alanine amidase